MMKFGRRPDAMISSKVPARSAWLLAWRGGGGLASASNDGADPSLRDQFARWSALPAGVGMPRAGGAAPCWAMSADQETGESGLWGVET